MKAAHTLGPWTPGLTSKPSEQACVIGAKNAEGFTPWVCHIQTAHVETANANARLIAESPNLLKVLSDLVANQDATWVAAGFTDEQIKAMPYLKPARAAIAKAGGAA